MRAATLCRNTATVEVTNRASNLEFSGGTTSSSGKLTKTSDGTLTLAGNQRYSGATTVDAGTPGLVGGSQTSTSSVGLTTGTVDNASDYPLMTASSFTGRPALDADFSGSIGFDPAGVGNSDGLASWSLAGFSGGTCTVKYSPDLVTAWATVLGPTAGTGGSGGAEVPIPWTYETNGATKAFFRLVITP